MIVNRTIVSIFVRHMDFDPIQVKVKFVRICVLYVVIHEDATELDSTDELSLMEQGSDLVKCTKPPI